MSVGVDIGGSFVKVATVEDDRVADLRRFPTPHAPRALFDAIAEAVLELDPKPGEIGCAIPGEVDASGRVLRLPNLPGFEGLPFAAELGARLAGARVVVENDGTSAGLAEARFGQGLHHPSFALLALGTGLGGAIVIEGKPWRGAHGFAGELGHVVADGGADAPVCGCGQRGCVEAFVGAAGLVRAYGDALAPSVIAERARAGESRALEVFRAAGDALGRLALTLQHVLDLDALVFAGGGAGALALYEPSLRARLRAGAFSPVLAELPLLASALGEHAGVVGASLLPTLPGAPPR